MKRLNRCGTQVVSGTLSDAAAVAATLPLQNKAKSIRGDEMLDIHHLIV